jgi:hypothetical protein
MLAVNDIYTHKDLGASPNPQPSLPIPDERENLNSSEDKKIKGIV